MTQTAELGTSTLEVAPGSIVVVRDEEWLVTAVDQTQDGALLTVQGITELVRDTTAMFYEGLDDIEVVDPRTTKVVGDSSARHRSARTVTGDLDSQGAAAGDDPLMTTSGDAVVYQHTSVARGLNSEILLAGAVGLVQPLAAYFQACQSQAVRAAA